MTTNNNQQYNNFSSCIAPYLFLLRKAKSLKFRELTSWQARLPVVLSVYGQSSKAVLQKPITWTNQHQWLVLRRCSLFNMQPAHPVGHTMPRHGKEGGTPAIVLITGSKLYCPFLPQATFTLNDKTLPKQKFKYCSCSHRKRTVCD